MVSAFAEAIVILVLGVIDAALFKTSRELGRGPVSAEVVMVDLALGLVTVWVLVLLAGVISKTLV